MYQSIILPNAQNDIRKSARWYNSRRKGLGKKFTAEIRKKIQFIKKNPHAAEIRYDEFRTTVLNVFPFMIHYFSDDESKTILIIAVLHTSRDSKSWKI